MKKSSLVTLTIFMSTAHLLAHEHAHQRTQCKNTKETNKKAAQKNRAEKNNQEKRSSFMPFHEDIIKLAKQNTYFRKEVATGKHCQVVLMSIPAGGEIGEEVHTVDQILFFVTGKGQAILDGVTKEILPNHLVLVNAGTKHNFKNTGTEDMKLISVYAPPQHKPGTIQKTAGEEY